jgi:signal transduction histidine kinase
MIVFNSKIIQYAILVFFSLLAAYPTFSQNKIQDFEYVLFNYEFEDNPQSVIELIQDESGYIWIITNYGIIRLDGKNSKRYTRFNYSDFNTNLFTRSLKIANTNFIFFADETEHLFMLDGKGNILSRNKSITLVDSILGVNEYETYLKSKLRFIIQEDKKASYFIDDYGKFYFNNDKGSELLIHNLPIESFFIDYRQHIYLNVMNDVYFLENEKYHKVKFWGLPDAGKEEEVTIFSSSGKELFVVFRNQLYGAELGDDPTIIKVAPIPGVYPISNVTSVLHDNFSNKILIGSLTEGLSIYKKKIFTSVINESVKKNTDFFYCVYPFSDSTVVTYSDNAFFEVGRNYLNKIYQNNDLNYSTFIVDSDKRIWNVDYEIGKINCLEPSWVNGFREYKNKSIIQLDSEVRHLKIIGEYLYALTNKSFYVLKINQRNSTAIVLKQFKIEFERKTRTNVFYQLSDNKFLVGFLDGILELDINTGLQNFNEELLGYNVRTIEYVEGLGVLLGTYGGGYFLYNDNNISSLPVDNKGYLNTVHSFIKYGDELWMSTNNGIVKVPILDLQRYLKSEYDQPRFQLFNKSNGLNSPEFNGGSYAACILNNNDIVLPSAGGVVFFNPAEMILPDTPPVYTYINKSSNNILFDNYYHIKTNDRLVINFQKFLGFDFTTQLVWYKITGINQNWNSVNVGENIYFDNLDAGSYVIRYTNIHPDMLNEDEIGYFTLYVNKIWYETWLFYGFVLLCLTLFIYGIVKIRIYYLQKRQVALEEEIAFKTSELVRLNKDLNLKNQLLQSSIIKIKAQKLFKDRMLTLLLHDFKSPVRYLLISIRELLLSGVWPNNKGSLGADILNSATRIYKFMDDFHSWVLSSEEGTVKAKYISFQEILYSVKELYDPIAKMRNCIIVIDCDDKVLKTYEFALKTIIVNLIDNAIKHTDNGVINIQVSDTLSYVNIEIKDNGYGMPSDVIHNLLTILEKKSIHIIPAIGVGFGYKFIGEFLRVLNALICIDSTPKSGTCITISLPR